MDICYKDMISGLPEALICHILSFLPTKEAALTSILSKQWRYLFALSPNLDFDDSILDTCTEISNQNREKIDRMFMDLVDRVLRLQKNSSINKFSLKCGYGVHGACISRWVLNVLERGVSDIDLRINVNWKYMMLGSVFVSNSLVRLRIDGYFAIIDVDYDIFLPKIKTLHLDATLFGDGVNCTLFKLVSGCRVLEELVLIRKRCNDYGNHSLSSKTLKRLTLSCEGWEHCPDSFVFYTPNLVYFEYSDHVAVLADKYKILNFDSLVEASIGLRKTIYQGLQFSYGNMVGNAIDLLMRINNVKTLYLSATILDVLTFCCEQIPILKNLIHLTIETAWYVGWESLPALLKNCPNLETLVFQGLHHPNKHVDRRLRRTAGEIRICLSSSPVKVIKILNFGEFTPYGHGTDWQMGQVKYFLEITSNLEQMILCYDTRIDEDLKSQLKILALKGASSKCNVQLVCDNLSEPTDH